MTSEIIASILLVSGGFFCLVAGIGIITLNDVYARMHAATKAGTLGLALICVATMILATTWLQLLEALFVFLFMIMTAPVGAHLIGRAAFRTRAPMDPRTRLDPDCDRFRPSKRSDVAAPMAPPAP